MLLAFTANSLCAQMVAGTKMQNFSAAMGIDGHEALEFSVMQTSCTAGPNVLWPGEEAEFTFSVQNLTAQPIVGPAKVRVVHYGTRGQPGDVWNPYLFRIDEGAPVSVDINIPAKKAVEFTVKPKIGEIFGGYALIVDLGAHGQAFAATCVRVPKANAARDRLPTYALDLGRTTYQVFPLFKKLGVKACRMEAGFVPLTAKDYDRRMQNLKQALEGAKENDVAVLLTIGAGSAAMPLGRGRPFLNDDNSMKDKGKFDLAWLPSEDEAFQKWVRQICAEYGWPKGAVNAVELWNEPWEGTSISGWGADMIRYREMYTHMAQGVIEARKSDGVKVLIGGACSSSNTRDKLFSDSTDGKYDGPFLKWLDFVSIHYQPLAADPSLVPEWLHRESEYGPVQVWDTESWVANSEDRVAAVIASMRAQGQSRTAGIFYGNVFTPMIRRVSKEKEQVVVQAWSAAAGIAAVQQFIGQRAFKELLFHNGLPWVFVFDGGVKVGDPAAAALNHDDSTLVVVGDLGGCYERARTRFRGVHGLKNIEKIKAARSALAAASDAKERKRLENALEAAEVLEGGTLKFDDGGGTFRLFDFYGNPVPSADRKITVPLSGLGFFLRTDGSPGSFERLCDAVRKADIRGYEPVDVEVHDLTSPIESKPQLHITVTNVLNRYVSGNLSVKLGDLNVDRPKVIALEPNETQEITMNVSGRPVPSNIYPLSLVFDANADGRKEHEELLHVNYIARRTMTIDGDLTDWNGVLPQSITAAQGIGTSLTERAWLPFEKLDAAAAKGVSIGYLAYDDSNFYFAAKIADDTPYDGNIRFANRDDDSYFYPPVVTDPKGKTLAWPEGVRRFSYRRTPDLPSGIGTDNVQIAFNVVPPEKKHLLPGPPGTLPRFMCYEDTDYEYALNAVSSAHGGGTEVWRLLAPGMPRKHFYPRQFKSAIDGGPVAQAKLVMKRVGNTRIVECALPWSEIPLVRKNLQEGQHIKFSFRVNNNDTSAAELAAGRSVSKVNFMAFHNDWVTHWANELEFGFEK
jgi:hypothetical protein